MIEILGVAGLMDYRGFVEEAWEQFASANNEVDEASPFLMSRTWDYDQFNVLRIRYADLMVAMDKAIASKRAEEAEAVAAKVACQEAAAAKVAEEAAAARTAEEAAAVAKQAKEATEAAGQDVPREEASDAAGKVVPRQEAADAAG